MVERRQNVKEAFRRPGGGCVAFLPLELQRRSSRVEAASHAVTQWLLVFYIQYLVPGYAYPLRARVINHFL
eukprot:SAG11_NODE_36105_length_263_cov_0.878049_1_plen_70_part_01